MLKLIKTSPLLSDSRLISHRDFVILEGFKT